MSAHLIEVATQRWLRPEEIFSILTGQFNEDGRIWQEILHEQNFY